MLYQPSRTKTRKDVTSTEGAVQGIPGTASFARAVNPDVAPINTEMTRSTLMVKFFFLMKMSSTAPSRAEELAATANPGNVTHLPANRNTWSTILYRIVHKSGRRYRPEGLFP